MEIKFTPNIDKKILELRKALQEKSKEVIIKPIQQEVQPRLITSRTVDSFEFTEPDTTVVPTEYDDILELMSFERRDIARNLPEGRAFTFRDDELFDPQIDVVERSYMGTKDENEDVPLAQHLYPIPKVLH